MNTDLLYEYLKEYSKESISKFDDIMNQAEQGSIFFEKDISQLCDLLFLVEKNLEDESSYNIDWTIKERIMETIIILTLKSPKAENFEAIAKAINKYKSISRPYLQYVIETFLTVFLLGTPQESENETAKNREAFLIAMKKYTENYQDILKNFYQSNLEELK